MIISRIDIYRLSIQMEPFAIATGTMDHAQNVFLRLHTSDGLYGVGECSAFPMIVGETQDTCMAMAKAFALLWKGKDAANIPARMQELHLFTAGNATIKSAFDMALYDLAAKAKGQSLSAFLGGESRPLETDITVGLGNPEEMARKAARFVAQGAGALKIKLGKNADDDIRRIRLIRQSSGDSVKIRVDANQGWTMDEAVKVLQGIQAYDIQFCEQPMRSWNDHLLPQLRALTSIKIMADESCYHHHDAARLIREEACDYINIKLAKSGGILEALAISRTAATAGIPCMMGGMLESRIALSANYHLACATPGIRFYDLDTCMLGHLEDPCLGGVRFDGFFLNDPGLPGIGADADDQFLKDCELVTI